MSGAVIKRMVEERRIVPDTLLWKRGMDDWVPAHRLKSLRWGT